MSASFIPEHALVTAESASPRAFMLVLHGIFGSGRNWRTFARKLTAQRPDWGAVLVDLRMHGASQAAPPPHSVAAAADDLRALTATLRARGHQICAVFGHSFGGKVALQYRAHATADLLTTWVIDASPSARPDAMSDPENTVAKVLRMLGALPISFARRQDFVAAVQAHGFDAGLGQWLAMNLERRDGTYVSRLDVTAMEALLRDYSLLDAWPAVSAGPGSLEVVVAGRSPTVSANDRERLARLQAEGATVHTTIIADSGHWVHIEALEPLLQSVASRLPAAPVSPTW